MMSEIKRRTLLRLSLSLVLLAWSCAPDSPAAGSKLDRVPEGIWGGDHASLQVRPDGASVEFDCAHGTLDEPIELDDDGRFDVEGVYVQEGPGPIPFPGPSDEKARYVGTLAGNALTFSVRLVDAPQTIGPHTVTLGREVQLHKCL